MPHTEEPFYKMKVGWAGDPKVEALARFGPVDACLGRDLFSQMIDYSRAELTDGLVPGSTVARVAYPLPAEDADRIVRQLADPGPFGPLCEWDAARSAWHVLAYARWNDTKAEVLARRAKGRDAALHRWKADARGNASGIARGNAPSNATGITGLVDAPGNAVSNAGAIHRARAQVDTEVEVEREPPLTPPHGTDAPSNARGMDDDELDQIRQVQALMAQAGRPVGDDEAATIRGAVLAKAGRVRDPRAYIGRVLGDPKQARTYAPHGGPQSKTIDQIKAETARPGGPARDVAARAAEARAGLEGRDRPLPTPATPDPARELHGEALARAQAAEAAARRAAAGDRLLPREEPPGDLPPEEPADDEPEEVDPDQDPAYDPPF
jgi:hypothetical protein